MALKELQELRTPSGDPVKVASAERDGSGENIEENYAKQTGYYSQLGAGTADNLRATIGSTDEADIVFRPTGGSADVSDGNAEIISVKGNAVDKDGSYVFTHFKGIKTIGFNQWNGEYVHVLPSESFNNYVISGSFDQVIWYETLENLRSHTDGITIEVLDGQNTSGEHYDYFAIAEEGYVEVTGSAADTCVAFIWSGYRVLDFEEYWTDTLEVDSDEYFPQGMAKAGSVYDELTSSKAITRIGRKDFSDADAVTVSEDEDIRYLIFDVAITLPGVKVSGAVASNVPDADVLEITETGVRFRALAANYGTAEAFKQAILGKTVLYELAEPLIEEVTVNMIYQVSDFGTEELLFDVLPPSVEIIFYQMNLRDKLQRLPGVGELNAALDSKADKTVVEEEYAKQDGHYPTLISGLADNLNSKTGTAQTTSLEFRTAGGSADISDGNAEITAIYGNTQKVDGEYVHSHVNAFESIGFNQWNGEYVCVMPSAEFNGYCISGTYLNAAWYPTIEDLRNDTNRIDLTILNGMNASGTHYQFFEIEQTGFVKVFGAGADTCVSFVWSGYRVGDFEKYWKHDLDIDSDAYFPDGMRSLESYKDEINGSEAIQRVGQYTFTGEEEVTIYSEDGDEIIFEVPAEIVNYGTEVGTNIPYITNNLLLINGTGVLTSSAINSIINNASPEKRAEITQVVVSTGFTEESAYKAVWATDFSALPLLEDNIFYGTKKIDFTTYMFRGSGVLSDQLVSEQIAAIPEARRRGVLNVIIPEEFTSYEDGVIAKIHDSFESLASFEWFIKKDETARNFMNMITAEKFPDVVSFPNLKVSQSDSNSLGSIGNITELTLKEWYWYQLYVGYLSAPNLKKLTLVNGISGHTNNFFSESPKLVYLDAGKDLGLNDYATGIFNKSSLKEFYIKNLKINLNISSTSLTYESVKYIVDNAFDYSNGAKHTLTLGSSNLSKLQEADIQGIYEKNWQLSPAPANFTLQVNGKSYSVAFGTTRNELITENPDDFKIVNDIVYDETESYVIRTEDGIFARPDKLVKGGSEYVLDNTLNPRILTIPFAGNTTLSAEYVEQIANDGKNKIEALGIVVPEEFTAYEAGAITAIKNLFINSDSVEIAFIKTVTGNDFQALFVDNDFPKKTIFSGLTVSNFADGRTVVNDSIQELSIKSINYNISSGYGAAFVGQALEKLIAIEGAYGMLRGNWVSGHGNARSPKFKELDLGTDIGIEDGSVVGFWLAGWCTLDNGNEVGFKIRDLKANMTISMSTGEGSISHDSLMYVINNLHDYSDGEQHTLKIGDQNLAKLTAEEIAVGTNKNWSIVAQ